MTNPVGLPSFYCTYRVCMKIVLLQSKLAETVTLHTCNVLMTEMHNSYYEFLFHGFLSALHVSNESSLSSSRARRNILYYTVWYNHAGQSSCLKAADSGHDHFLFFFIRH